MQDQIEVQSPARVREGTLASERLQVPGPRYMYTGLTFERQDGDVPGSRLIGGQDASALYPGLDAIIFNFSYGFDL